MKRSLLLASITALSLSTAALIPAAAQEPRNFLYTSSGTLEELGPVLERPDIEGVQIIYNWRQLEPSFGEYDFSMIEKDLAQAEKAGKKLFIQIQDRFFFIQARNVPDYLLNEAAYAGGLVAQKDYAGEGEPEGHGWVAMQWNPAVRERFQALLNALGERFDGRVFGMNLPETSIDIDMEKDKTAFSCDAYFDAEIENLAAARNAFKKSHVVQYVNFWPCEWANDQGYMERIFAYAAENKIGLGNPDIVPGRKGQMKNSYPFFNQYKGELDLVAMAVQEPTLTYTNPETGKPFSKEEFVRFAEDYLGVDIIFWSARSPWLK